MIDTLINHEYIDELKTYDKKEKCDSNSGVYIFNTENGNDYEVCLICGDYRSSGDYCNGIKSGQINITGETNTGEFYNPLLSYTGASWTSASSVDITFTFTCFI